MNLGIFTGHIGKTAEIRATSAGRTVCSWSLAVKCGFGENAKTMWIRCNLWGKRAESGLPQYLVKGQQVCVSGELSLNEYTTQAGETRTTLELNVDNVDLVGAKAAPQPQQGIVPTPEPVADNFDDDIPF